MFTQALGFHKAVFDDLKHQAGKLNDIQKYVVLMLNEVSIKDDLVYDKVTGELVGFVNLANDVDDCYTIQKRILDGIASLLGDRQILHCRLLGFKRISSEYNAPLPLLLHLEEIPKALRDPEEELLLQQAH